MCVVHYGMVVVTETVVHVFKRVALKCLLLNMYENLLIKYSRKCKPFIEQIKGLSFTINYY